MKIPRELADLFEKFINKNPSLGFRKVSQYILSVLQERAKELIGYDLEIKRQKVNTIKLAEGTYTKEELLELLEKSD